MLVELRDELVAEGIHYWDLKDEGDVAGHRYIMSALTAARPDDVILSEEAADNRKRLSAERVWIIDPIDGTNEFAEHPTRLGNSYSSLGIWRTHRSICCASHARNHF